MRGPEAIERLARRAARPAADFPESPLPDRSDVLAALDALRDPKTGRGLVEAGLVQGLVVAENRAG
uniref:iron-sulfur cluster assembly protein n=1 Tax=Klebsiella pneumoniae TaxID=573 RepID=UPI0034D1BF5C